MNDEHQQLIEDCEAREQQMNEWEREFVASIRSQLKRGLSPKQVATLNSIWERVTSSRPRTFTR